MKTTYNIFNNIMNLKAQKIFFFNLFYYILPLLIDVFSGELCVEILTSIPIVCTVIGCMIVYESPIKKIFQLWPN